MILLSSWTGLQRLDMNIRYDSEGDRFVCCEDKAVFADS